MPWLEQTETPPSPVHTNEGYDGNQRHYRNFADRSFDNALHNRINALLSPMPPPTHPSFRFRLNAGRSIFVSNHGDDQSKKNRSQRRSFDRLLSPLEINSEHDYDAANATSSRRSSSQNNEDIEHHHSQSHSQRNKSQKRHEKERLNSYNGDVRHHSLSNRENRSRQDNSSQSTFEEQFCQQEQQHHQSLSYHEPSSLTENDKSHDSGYLSGYQPRQASTKSNTYRQLTLEQDGASQGKLVLTSATNPAHGNHDRSWEAVGRIGNLVGGEVGENTANKPRKTKKRSKENKRKKRKKKERTMGQDEYGNIILSENHATHADDLEEAEEENEFQPKHSKRKKSKLSCASAASPSIPNKIQDPHKKRRSKKRPRAFGGTHSFSLSQQPTLTEETFYGIEDTEILNAGQSNESLAEFLRMYRTQTYISWTLVFLDINFTTPFLPSCEKYCTEKGPRCTHWNCTCENQVRGIQARAPIMGAMFVFPVQDSTQDDNASELMCFVLPLGRCKNLDDEPEALPHLEAYERMKSWSLIPFICGVSIQRRWDTFRFILTNKFIKCVTFNAIVSLMPFHFHKSQSEDRSTQGDCGGDNGSCNTAQTMLDLILPSIWDLKLATWMLKPHKKEEELEFEKFTTGFPHLRPAPTTRPNGASYQLLGMLQAKDMLNFLYNLYPIVSSSIERKGLSTSLEEIEGPLQGILAAMECTGIGFLPSRLSSIQQNLESRIDALEVEARHIANDNTFLLSSPQQVSHILFDVLKIKMPSNLPPSKAASGSQHRSTSEAILQAIQAKSPIRIVEILLEFRSLNKLLTSYIRPLPRLARDFVQGSSDDGKNSRVRIHPMWMQTAVRTGRLSCRKPNMQQVPKGGTFGVAPRDSFCASSDELCLFACDYSQNEVRILAHMSNDKQLIQMFGNDDGIDIYKQMSSSITGKPVENVSDKERSIAKQVVLAILYGMGIPQVANKLSVDRTTAQRFFNLFYSRFRGVKAWIDSTKESARKNGYVSTIVGRRRYLDEIQSEDNGKRAQAERQAVNTIIQGSAADLMKLAMLKMASRLMDWNKEGVNTGGTGIAPKLILQIHDELLFEVMANSGDVNRLKAAVLRCCAGECERDLKLKVPLKMTCSVGKSWGVSMQEMK